MIFLQRVLARLSMCWPGFKNVAGRVNRRLSCRVKELKLANFAEHRSYLEKNTEEWFELDELCCNLVLTCFDDDLKRRRTS